MRFTCLIINFLQVLTFQQGPVLERRKRGREMERGKRAWGRRAEGRMSARNTSSALPNTETGLSRLSLSSYFIPFVTGTRTGLQRRLQWAHQSTPTDCGPTDTLEVGINFFVENVEKATAKWGNESSFFFFCYFLPPSSCFAVVSASFFPSQSLHMSKEVRVRPAPCFCQMLVWGGFRPPFCLFCLPFLRSFALPSRRLFWQALLEFSPHGSGRKSMPICVFSCSALYWWRLGERKKDRWVKSRDSSTDYRQNIHQTVHLFTKIMDE